MKLETTQVGIAGEYLVAGELSLRGFVAAITLRNTRGTDIITSTSDGGKSVSVQVKTNSTGKALWMVGKKSEDFASPSHFYVFVALHELLERPSYHIVPSQIVAERITTSHRDCLGGTKADGTARKDSSIRKFEDLDGVYRERWEMLFSE